MNQNISQSLYLAGSDGSDYIHRQQIANQYTISALNKTRLKCCIFFHCLLLFAMIIKLLPDLLDKMDIFILEIEELQVPKPLMWEYLWCLTVFSNVLCFIALRRNNIKIMKYYIMSILLFSYVPLIYGFCYYFKSLWNYFIYKDDFNIEFIANYPYGLLWYIFITIGFQIHLFSLFFACNLIKVWRTHGKKHM